jgi:hypothetical protein
VGTANIIIGTVTLVIPDHDSTTALISPVEEDGTRRLGTANNNLHCRAGVTPVEPLKARSPALRHALHAAQTQPTCDDCEHSNLAIRREDPESLSQA